MILFQNHCLCQENSFFDYNHSSCVKCQDDCDGCINNPQSCKTCNESCFNCPENSSHISDTCICNEGYFSKNASCLQCLPDCLNCFGSQIYTCSKCKSNTLKSTCFNICPYGYNIEDSKCVIDKSSGPVFSFEFKEINISKNNSFELTDCNNDNESFFSLPKSYYKRGLYFDGLSSCLQLIKDDEFRSLVTVEFIFIFWLKALNSNSNIFSAIDCNSSKIFSIELKEFALNIEILIENEKFSIESDQVIDLNWKSIAISLKYNNFSSISIIIDKVTLNIQSLSSAPLIESNVSDYLFGFDPNLSLNKLFMGFIYKILLKLDLSRF